MKRDDRLELLDTFVKIGETGSLSSAGQERTRFCGTIRALDGSLAPRAFSQGRKAGPFKTVRAFLAAATPIFT
jgi:hypothetical protein